jgi:hypothetical protein
MKAIKNFVLYSFFILLLMPAVNSYAQVSEADAAPQEEIVIKEKKSDKKKDKDKIQINENFFICLAIDVVTVLLIILLIYYPNNRNKDYIFTFIIFNIIIFLLTFVLNKVKISMGAAFGLFAVFSMLRYRTAGISMKDMTYLFIFIALGLIGAIQLEYYELAILNGVIILFTFVLDGNVFMKREFLKTVQYENIEMIKPENHKLLIEDLRMRTGLNIHRITINKIDFLKDTANISIYFYD